MNTKPIVSSKQLALPNPNGKILSGTVINPVVNAITRAAHEEPWSSPWATDELEQQAGDLLYQKVWNVRFDETEAM